MQHAHSFAVLTFILKSCWGTGRRSPGTTQMTKPEPTLASRSSPSRRKSGYRYSVVSGMGPLLPSLPVPLTISQAVLECGQLRHALPSGVWATPSRRPSACH